MNDAALTALYTAFSEATGPLWWFADEHVADVLPPVRSDCLVWTNRCNTAARLEQHGFVVNLGDFRVPPVTSAPETVLYRVSKEKLLVHHLINLALAHLPVGGRLLLSGFKNDGLKTYADKAAKLVGGKASISKCAHSAYLAEIVVRAAPASRLNDDDYSDLRQIADDPLLFSKPGIFGWQKRDRGSVLLVEQLPRFLAEFPAPPRTVLDLGCGYGYLAVMASQHLPDCRWLLTDNNATALVAATKNMAIHGLEGEAVLDDCAAGIAAPVEAIVCNPPFHQGFAVEGDLTDRFLSSCARLLRPGGQALFVVNQFIPLQRKAQGLFASDELLFAGDGFNVIRLRR